MNSSFKVFWVLMWKNLHLRKKRWIMTLLEIFLPILVVYQLGETNNSLEGPLSNKHNASKPAAHSISDLYGKARSAYLVYTPFTNLTKKIMDGVGSALDITDVKSVTDEIHLESFLLNKNESTRMSWKGIVFQNVTTNGLIYKIRTFDQWYTNRLFPEDDQPGPNNEDEYFEGFAGLQLAIDSAFLQIQSKKLSDQHRVKFQPFPYPEYIGEIYLSAVLFVIILVSTFLSISLMGAVIDEKEDGLKELMKIAGVKEWLMWASWFTNAFVVCFVSSVFVVFLLYHDFNGLHSAVMGYTNPIVLFTFIMVYYVSHISFCFMFSAIFHTPRVASSIFTLFEVVIVYGSSQVSKYQSLYLVKLLCWFPAGALIQGFSRITFAEMNGVQLSWTSLGFVEKYVTGVSLGFAFFILLCQTFLFFLLTYYIAALNPGKFGLKKSPFFMFERWTSKSNDHSQERLINLEDDAKGRFFEEAPNILNASIRVEKLYKSFGTMFAVKNVNVDVYEGEIMVLLGHNGAGKTTTLSVLTGMSEPTAGSIIYKNKINILQKMDEFRQDLGMCPQENRLFKYLTVLQHLLFFGMLKGFSKKFVEAEAKKYLKIMDLEFCSNRYPATLSGGMKRKLCLSIALMGQTQTLILDEPTSGMDVQSRRKMWDLLLQLRENRTIILTTHYMEEADALGDRIAIMNQGTIVCHGTPMFLKKSYETGYKLTMSKQQGFNRDRVSQIVAGVLNSETDNETDGEIVYKLPLTETAKFANMFRALEREQSVLGIKTMSLNCTTMEQVFHKVSDESIQNLDTTGGNLASSEHLTGGKKRGVSLIRQQLGTLLKKKFLYTIRQKSDIFSQIILPTIILILLLGGASSPTYTYLPLTLSLKTYSNSKVMLSADSSEMTLRNRFADFVKVSGSHILDVNNTDIIESLLQYGRKDIRSFRRELVVAAEFNASERLMVYNRWALHSLPVAINTYSNVLLKTMTNNSQNIITINHPIKPPTKEEITDNLNILNLIVWYIALCLYTVYLVHYFSSFLTMEQVSGFKHLQFMSSLSPFVYWLSTLIWDVSFFLTIIILRMALFKIFVDRIGFLSIDQNLAVLLFITVLFGVCGLLFLYVINSMFNGTKERSGALWFIFYVVCSIVIGIYLFLDILSKSLKISWKWNLCLFIVRFLICIVPPFTYILMFIKFLIIWSNNAVCSISQDCEFLKRWSYLEMPSETNPYGFLPEVLNLIGLIFLYGAILAIIELDYFNKLSNYVYRCMYNGGVSVSSLDPDVKKERDLVQSLSSRGIHPNSSNVVLLSEGLEKRFGKTSFTAVADLSFAIKPGECFGLLGVNGAGKSTSFKMLTGALWPTEGDATLNGVKLGTRKIEYISKAGYCPQDNSFIENLSGREMLTLIASLRGFNKAQIKEFVDKWISAAGLESCQYRKCKNYSGGSKRKLCTAMSLIGDPSVVFLDEPTTGVDPTSKRKLYEIMEQSKSTGQAVVLSSHSLDECENMCDRLTIMSQGQMKCIGTAHHLKQRFAQGFSITIKLRDPPMIYEQITTVKNDMTQLFKPEYCILKDEHNGLLYYHVKDVRLFWSQLFEKMEQIKRNHNIVDDYTVRDTSLEEVFIAFAR